MKHLKMSVDYEHPAKGMNTCGQCTHFEPRPDFGSCSKVAGKIDSADWCKLWKSK